MTEPDSLQRAEELLSRLEETRAELGKVSAEGNADAAIGILAELAEIARQVEMELERAKREADAGES
ncbi:MAG: hypothetical protein H0U03_05325 [Actinobacteria bacterium]|nr:hypothetical protein [Actinomycetota bacterium]